MSLVSLVRLANMWAALEVCAETPSDGRVFVRTMVTTGERLVEDVKRLYCLTCLGTGSVAGAYPWDDDCICPDCHGFCF